MSEIIVVEKVCYVVEMFFFVINEWGIVILMM